MVKDFRNFNSASEVKKQGAKPFLLLLTILTLIFIAVFGWKYFISTDIEQNDQLEQEITHAKMVEIPLHSMIELDFKSKDEIYIIRKNAVLQNPDYFKSNYEPSNKVFGQIENGKPWWGILGLSYYGNEKY